MWKFYDNSPKRLAAYLKIQMSVKQLQEPSKEVKDKNKAKKLHGQDGFLLEKLLRECMETFYP